MTPNTMAIGSDKAAARLENYLKARGLDPNTAASAIDLQDLRAWMDGEYPCPPCQLAWPVLGVRA